MSVTRGAASVRLCYSDLRPADIGALAALVSDPDVADQLGSWPWPPNPALVVARCRPSMGGGFLWGVRREGRMIGTVGVDAGARLGYMLRPAYWSQGLATEAAATAISHALRSYGFPNIMADVWEDNAASARVLEKLGFVETEAVPDWSRARRTIRARRAFVLSRSRWTLPPGPP